MKTTIKLLKEANWMKKAGGDLYPLWGLEDSLDVVCGTVDALIYDERVYELLDEINISDEEYEVARNELKVIADILCPEVGDP